MGNIKLTQQYTHPVYWYTRTCYGDIISTPYDVVCH